jgi:hypothetical protein
MANRTRTATTRKRWGVLAGALCLFVFAALGTAGTALADDPAGHTSAPWIASDKPDYFAGDAVVLNGGSWQSGETVRINVNDDEGHTWVRDGDVTADANGNISDSFNLPNWFVAVYTIRAVGSSGSTATSSFTDGNLRIRLNTTGSDPGAGWTATVRIFTDSNCTTQDTGQPDVTVPVGAQANVPGNRWGKPISVNAPGYAVDYWSDTATGSATSNLCKDGNGNKEIFARFSVVDATPPTTVATATPAANAAGWNNTNVSVSLDATDNAGGSGVKEITYSASGAQTIASTTVTASSVSGINITAEGETTLSFFAKDNAGNVESTKTKTIKIDKTAPSVAYTSASPAPNGAGWSNTDVVATFTATDTVSGFDTGSTKTGTSTTSGEGPVTVGSPAFTDLAGNGAAAGAATSAAFKIDKTKPVITRKAADDSCSEPGANGWCRGTQTAGFTATDATSGFEPSGDLSVDFTQSSSTNGSAVDISSGTKTDRAGNVADAIDAGPFMIDSVKPVITRRPTDDSCSAPGAHDWCRGTQTAGFTATDATSGFAPSGALSVDFTQSSSTNGSAVNVDSGTKADLAGNVADAIDAGPFQIDSVAPSLALRPAGDGCSDAGDNGWCKGTQTAGFRATDATSGFDATGSSPYDFTQSTGTNGAAVMIASGPVSDWAGNSTGSIDAGPFMIDSVAPSLALRPAADSCSDPGDNGWCKGTQTAGFRATDGMSGFDAGGSSPYDFIKSTGLNGAAVTIASGAVSDWAGNSTGSIDAGPFMIDSVKPEISDLGPTTSPSGAGWYKTNVANRFKASDTLSGPNAACLTAFPEVVSGGRAQAKTTTGEGPAVKVGSDSCTDDAGNTADAIDSAAFKIDQTKPEISDLGPTTSSNGAGWYKTNVTNRFKASDALSGPNAACLTAFPELVTGGRAQAKTTTGEGPAVKVGSDSCTDDAGNTADAIDSAAFKIDLTAPSLNVNGSPSGNSGVCSALPARPTYAPSDLLSGLDGTEGDSWVTPGTPTGVGTYTYAAHATDRAGNASSEMRTYVVTYGASVAASPFLQPINADGTSRFKLASTIPVKFHALCNGTPVAGVVARMFVARGDNQPDPGVDEPISTAASTTGNLFRYDGNAQHIFNLGTKLGYYDNPGGTRVTFGQGSWTLKIGLDDGTFRSVNVQLVR